MVYKNVRLGENCIIQQNVQIGVPSRPYLHRDESEWPVTHIGSHSTVRSGTIIYCDVTIGENFESGHNLLIREKTVVGNNVLIGSNAVIEDNLKIGNDVKIQSMVFIPGLTVIEDDVFIGPNVIFLNDPHPMKCPKYKECLGGATVKKLVRIGANSTIFPGIVIGENSVIGAGAVVTKDVPPNSVAVGNPARITKKTDELKCYPGFFERPYLWPPYSEEK